MRHLLRLTLVLALGCAAAVATLEPAPARSAATPEPAAGALPAGSEDELAKTYYRLLLANTRFQESTWNEAEGSYGIANWDVVGTLGNAVLLKFGTYDAEAAGVSKAVLRDHTVRSIAKAAAQNRFVDPEGGTWGAYVYWDAAFEAYLVAAAKLMWADLGTQTRSHIETILRGEASYLVEAGAVPPDPAREGGTTNGLTGGYAGDTKAEEMGHRSMMLAAAHAHLPDDPASSAWREWLDRWTVNMTGLPVADQANPAEISGVPIAAWARSQNIFDTYISENHGSWNGMYQQSAGAYPGRNLIHYLIAGRPIPRSQLAVPSGDELFRTMDRLGTNAGVPVEHMIGDRAHLYGRSLLPLTYRAVALGDRMSARAERMLAERLEPYLAHPPAGRLVKFRPGTQYETEARAEVAMAYLLHYWRDRLAGDVEAVSERGYFARASGVTDFGEVPGLVAQQTPASLTSAIAKPGYVKFAFLPQHDDWFVNPVGTSPAFLPSVAAVDGSTTRTYTELRDGLDATATVVHRAGSYAGFTTLPDGSVVYATSGTDENEGALRLFNLDMPGMPGLDGDRTFTTARSTVTLADDGLGGGGTDELVFPATEARYVRMLGLQAQSQWGYSMYEFEVRNGADGTNLAAGRPASASSSYGDQSAPAMAVDGDPATRWANSAAERSTMKGWYSVDLGDPQPIDRVHIQWQEDAWPLSYRIEVSDDGEAWRPVASVPDWQPLEGGWLNLDGRAGFVVRGSTNPIAVSPTAVALSYGPAEGSAGMVVQAFPGQRPADTAAAAGRPQPTGGPDRLASALTDGYLSLINLSGRPIADATLTVPQAGRKRLVYLGVQHTSERGITYEVSLGPGSAAVEAPRFRVSADGPVSGLRVEVADSRQVTLTNESNAPQARVRVTSASTGESDVVAVPRGQTRTLTFGRGIRTPTEDLARDRITYPSSPLPVGMTDPGLAVDADRRTAWVPGASDRRIVVNLGERRTVGSVDPIWSSTAVPAYTITTSNDGTTWSPFTEGVTARYVSVNVGSWEPSQAGLAELRIGGPPG